MSCCCLSGEDGPGPRPGRRSTRGGVDLGTSDPVDPVPDPVDPVLEPIEPVKLVEPVFEPVSACRPSAWMSNKILK